MWMKNEDELVEEVLRGKHGSFELLLRPYSQGFLNMAYRMTGDLEEAKEVCQEAVIKIFRYLSRFKKGRIFRNWAYKITVNSAYDFLRRKRKYEDTVKDQERSAVSLSSGPEKQLLNKELSAEIEACLQNLSPKEKAIFLLRDAEGFSVEETSGILGCSSPSVRTHLSRARQKIRARLEKIYFSPEREVKG